MDFSATFPLVWPLLILLGVLILGRKIGDDMKPLFSSIITGLSTDAQKNARVYGFAILLAFTASTDALATEATKLGWLMLASACRVFHPGLVAIIGLIAQQRKNDSNTNAPFPRNP